MNELTARFEQAADMPRPFSPYLEFVREGNLLVVRTSAKGARLESLGLGVALSFVITTLTICTVHSFHLAFSISLWIFGGVLMVPLLAACWWVRSPLPHFAFDTVSERLLIYPGYSILLPKAKGEIRDVPLAEVDYVIMLRYPGHNHDTFAFGIVGTDGNYWMIPHSTIVSMKSVKEHATILARICMRPAVFVNTEMKPIDVFCSDAFITQGMRSRIFNECEKLYRTESDE